MKKIFLFSFVLMMACTTREQKKRSNEQLDSLVKKMTNRFNDFFMRNEIDSAKMYLGFMSDTVGRLNYNRLTLYWTTSKAQLQYSEQEYDSLKITLDQAVRLSQAKDIIPKDLLNFYIIYNGHLKSLGMLDSALFIANEANLLAKKIDTTRLTQTNLDLAGIYRRLDDFPNFKKYAFEAYRHVKQEPELKVFIDGQLSDYYDEIGDIDSSIYYFNSSLKDSFWVTRPLQLGGQFENTGVYLIQKGKLKEGFDHLIRAKAIYDSLGHQDVITYLNLAETNGMMKQYKKAFAYIDTAKQLAAKQNSPYLIRTAWQSAAELYLKVPDIHKAYAALDSAYVNYTIERDSTLRKYGREMDAKYAGREKDIKIASLAVTNEINQKVQHQQRIIIIAIIVTFLALGMSAMMFWRRRQLKFLLRESYLQQKVLQSQMEPHFVANILSVLKSFIRSGDQDRSIAFLQQFGRVTEQNLQNAQAHLITVQAELTAIDQYLALQSMQLANSFSYHITRGADLEEDQIRIPPMLVQPFVENALTHGISGLDYKGAICISVDRLGPLLRCVVEDNGRGLVPHQQDPGSRVHAITIAKERLALVRWQTGQRAQVEVLDKKDEGGQGVRVTLDIPWQYETGSPTSAPNRYKV